MKVGRDETRPFGCRLSAFERRGRAELNSLSGIPQRPPTSKTNPSQLWLPSQNQLPEEEAEGEVEDEEVEEEEGEEPEEEELQEEEENEVGRTKDSE